MTDVILLHAFPVNSSLWQDVSPALEAAGHQVWTPDLRGFGSARHPGTTYDDIVAAPNLDEMADDVIRLMNAAGLRRAVVGGCSMGGYVTMSLLRRHSDRLAGVVLVDTKAADDLPEAAQRREEVAAAVLSAGTTEALARAMLPTLLGSTTHETRPDIVDVVRSWIHGTDPRAVAWAQRAMAQRPNSHAALAAFSGPSLVIWGNEDVISPRADQDAIRDALAHSTFAEIAESGHLSPVEAPKAVVTALLGWLGSAEFGDPDQ